MTSKFFARITQIDLTHLMIMLDRRTISVETLRINNEYSLRKDFFELIYMNTLLILYVTLNKFNLCDNFATSS